MEMWLFRYPTSHKCGQQRNPIGHHWSICIKIFNRKIVFVWLRPLRVRKKQKIDIFWENNFWMREKQVEKSLVCEWFNYHFPSKVITEDVIKDWDTIFVKVARLLFLCNFWPLLMSAIIFGVAQLVADLLEPKIKPSWPSKACPNPW